MLFSTFPEKTIYVGITLFHHQFEYLPVTTVYCPQKNRELSHKFSSTFSPPSINSPNRKYKLNHVNYRWDIHSDVTSLLAGIINLRNSPKEKPLKRNLTKGKYNRNMCIQCWDRENGTFSFFFIFSTGKEFVLTIWNKHSRGRSFILGWNWFFYCFHLSIGFSNSDAIVEPGP